MIVTEEEYVKNRGTMEKIYLDMASEYVRQLCVALSWKCREFDSQELIAMWFKKNEEIISLKKEGHDTTKF